MCDIHELDKNLSYAGRGISTSDIWSRSKDLVNGSILFTFLFYVPFKIFCKVFIEKILGITHV